jgi:hypothetical protein
VKTDNRNRFVAKFQTLLIEWGYDPDENFAQPQENDSCRTVVFTKSSNDDIFPTRLRSYTPGDSTSISSYSIFEAVRAVVSDPECFDVVIFGDSPVSFRKLTGAYRNSAKEALNEATLIWSQGICGLVSVGCEIVAGDGLAKFLSDTIGTIFEPIEKIIPENVKDAWKIEYDVNRVAEEVKRDTQTLGVEYFRFNFTISYHLVFKREDLHRGYYHFSRSARAKR